MIYLKLVVAVLVFIHVVRVYLHSKRNYPPLDYKANSSENLDRWRWRVPDEQLELQLEDGEDSSHLILSGSMIGYEKMFVVFGYMMVGLAIYGLLFRAFFSGIGMDGVTFAIFLIILLLGYGAINVGQYVSRIILYPDKLEFEVSYGFFFKRIKTYRRKPRLRFRSDEESFMQLTSSHSHPRTRLHVKAGFVFSKLYTLPGNPSQNSWIVDGLEHWKSEPTAEQSSGQEAKNP